MVSIRIMFHPAVNKARPLRLCITAFLFFFLFICVPFVTAGGQQQLQQQQQTFRILRVNSFTFFVPRYLAVVLVASLSGATTRIRQLLELPT
jgi:hypothetical protein